MSARIQKADTSTNVCQREFANVAAHRESSQIKGDNHNVRVQLISPARYVQRPICPRRSRRTSLIAYCPTPRPWSNGRLPISRNGRRTRSSGYFSTAASHANGMMPDTAFAVDVAAGLPIEVLPFSTRSRWLPSIAPEGIGSKWDVIARVRNVRQVRSRSSTRAGLRPRITAWLASLCLNRRVVAERLWSTTTAVLSIRKATRRTSWVTIASDQGYFARRGQAAGGAPWPSPIPTAVLQFEASVTIRSPTSICKQRCRNCVKYVPYERLFRLASHLERRDERKGALALCLGTLSFCAVPTLAGTPCRHRTFRCPRHT